MLEDNTIMEKKPNGRSNQTPVKPGTEGKKNADTLPFGKYNRRREPNSVSGGKNETVRKASNSNAVKQGKFTDKRPKPRGQYYGGGKQEPKVEELESDPEYGSQLAYGRKKQNLNHLLNFTLAPRAGAAVGTGNGGANKSGNWMATHKHKYNKEQFLQANCQFVVKKGLDYKLHLVDPDTLVEWSNIEQIRLRTTELMVCPICLDLPIAGKMTRCGHVYCWPCVLHYLALSDKSWRKCPICYEAIHRKDLKSVITVENSQCRVGEEFTFRLMKRERGSLLPIPVAEDDAARDKMTPLAVSEALLTTVYSKLLMAEESDVARILRSERIELEAAMKDAQDEPEVCFIEQALELLGEREMIGKPVTGGSDSGSSYDGELDNSKKTGADDREEIKTLEKTGAITLDERARLSSDDADLEISKETGAGVELEGKEETLKVAEDPFADVEDEDSDEGLPNVSPEDVETEHQVTGLKPFYFYQAMDGQNVFLTALNLRMLETQYGGLVNAPLNITGPVLEKESGSMTRELRNRLRSLSHLPITAAFELLELNLSSLVSQDVLEGFAEPLLVRAERRRRREREERRRERRITQETSGGLGGGGWGGGSGQRRARIRLDSEKHFPRCGEEEAVGGGTSTLEASRADSMSSVSSLPELDYVTSLVSQQFPSLDESASRSPSDIAGPSFAQMLKAGAKPSRPRRSAWGRDVAASAVTSSPSARMMMDGDDDEYSVPRYQPSFSDVIAQALEKADLNADEGGSWKKNKKKKKQKVVFSCGMSFAAK